MIMTKINENEAKNLFDARQKAKAIELLELLQVYTPYVKAFTKENKVFVFENFIGFEIEKTSQLYKDIQQFQSKYNGLVFAVTHEILEFGECFSYLYLPKYENEWDTTIQCDFSQKVYNVYCYVQNKDIPEFSEFGSIGIQSAFGGIKRIY